ncbi:MAG: hypothetical protein AAB794_00440 [Patescibacteria group bacterium]
MGANSLWSIIALALVAISLFFIYRIHTDPGVDFDVTDILKKNGRASRQAVLEVGAWFATTFVLIHQELEQTLTDTYVAAYVAAWILKGLTQVVRGDQSSKPEDKP